MIGTILIFIAIPIVALFINAVEEHNRSIPFDSVYTESGIPVVTLTNNGKEFNFLVDTGANMSLFDERHLNDLEHTKVEGEGIIYGMEGAVKKVEYVRANIQHEKSTFNVEFQLVDMQTAFDRIQREHNILLHGVLGTEFLEENKGNIDFIEHKLNYEQTKDKAAFEGQNEQLAGTLQG